MTKSNLKPYLQIPFLLTVIILGGAAGFMYAAKNILNIEVVKEPIPLKTSFDQMDESRLSPYHVVRKSTIENKDVIESLGTEEYLEWVVEDVNSSAMNPARYCHILITYYTGNPDQVPHVPEACYTGGGARMLEKDDVLLELDAEDANNAVPEKLNARCITFSSSDGLGFGASSKFNVLYFFKVNGKYRGNRNTTRLALSSNITGKYSYFSKVELKFSGRAGFANKEQTIDAAQKFLPVLLTVLEQDHWPDWE